MANTSDLRKKHKLVFLATQKHNCFLFRNFDLFAYSIVSSSNVLTVGDCRKTKITKIQPIEPLIFYIL